MALMYTPQTHGVAFPRLISVLTEGIPHLTSVKNHSRLEVVSNFIYGQTQNER